MTLGRPPPPALSAETPPVLVRHTPLTHPPATPTLSTQRCACHSPASNTPSPGGETGANRRGCPARSARPPEADCSLRCRQLPISTDNNAHCPICCLLAVRRVCRVPSAGFHGHPRSIDATAPQGEPRFHSRGRVRKQSRGSAEELAHGHTARQRRSRHLRRVCLSGPASLVFIRGWFERGLIYFV